MRQAVMETAKEFSRIIVFTAAVAIVMYGIRSPWIGVPYWVAMAI